MGSPQRIEGMTGTVVRAAFGSGSKSEQEAIWLDTGDQRVVLRRKDGPTFGDRSLDKFVGKRVTCDGYMVGYSLLAERIEPVT